MSSHASFIARAQPRCSEAPELALPNDRHLVPHRRKPTDLDQLRSTIPASDLQSVGTAAHQHIGGPPRSGLDDGAGPFRRDDRFLSRALEVPREREALPRQAGNSTESRIRRPLTKRRDEFTGRLVPSAPRAEAAMDHFLEMVAARQRANVLATHCLRDVAAQEHGRDESDLIDVVALLPAAYPTPCDFRGHVEQIEG